MKKSFVFGLIALMVVFGITGCQSELDADVIEVPDYPSDVIDWNIYSWQEDGDWVYSIVDRNAGYTTFEEISMDEWKLPGLDYLVEALDHLPDNSELFWSEYIIPGTELPPEELLYEILNYCNAIGVPVVVLN